jgi:CBS domain-containing protein
MKINQIMTPDPQVVSPVATVNEAAGLMRDLDVGMIPVCDGEHLRGMITDRDIAIRGVAEGLDLATTPVDRLMTPDVLYCFEDQTTGEAAEMMDQNQVRRLVVLNRDKRLTGIVSIGDLATKTDEKEELAKAVEGISEPALR